MASTGISKAAGDERRLSRLAESIQRHEAAIAAERRAVIAATARIAERKVRVKRLRELQERLADGGNKALAV